MIKLVYLVARRPGLAEADFVRYWRDVHAPLGARIPGVRRLVQSHALPGANPRPVDFDGMAELWFDDLDALLRARDTPEWRASADVERVFVDAHRVACFVAEEHEVALAPPSIASPFVTIPVPASVAT